MSSNKRVIIVTGSYKGIGFEIVRLLCEHYGDKASVFMTSRSEAKAADSLNRLREKGLNPSFAELDITSKESVAKLRQLIETQHGGVIHSLINNAAISYNGNTTPFAEQAEGTIRNNYFGHVLVCETLLPIMAPSGCVVNVTGQLGSLRQVSSELQQVFAQAPDVATISSAMQIFVDKAQLNQHRQHGFSNSCLGMSKLGVMAVARVQARELASKNVSVMNMCPGWSQTDMAGYNAPQTAAEGADTVIWLETMDPQKQMQATGRFFKSRTEIPW